MSLTSTALPTCLGSTGLRYCYCSFKLDNWSYHQHKKYDSTNFVFLHLCSRFLIDVVDFWNKSSLSVVETWLSQKKKTTWSIGHCPWSGMPVFKFSWHCDVGGAVGGAESTMIWTSSSLYMENSPTHLGGNCSILWWLRSQTLSPTYPDHSEMFKNHTDQHLLINRTFNGYCLLLSKSFAPRFEYRAKP